MDHIEHLANEIIDDCQRSLSGTSRQTPNVSVIKVILKEFVAIRDYYEVNKKVLLLSNKVWKLWSRRTIIDSADYNFDSKLFDKVQKFEDFCSTLEESLIVYKHK